jgi:hypothetical protein
MSSEHEATQDVWNRAQAKQSLPVLWAGPLSVEEGCRVQFELAAVLQVKESERGLEGRHPSWPC